MAPLGKTQTKRIGKAQQKERRSFHILNMVLQIPRHIYHIAFNGTDRFFARFPDINHTTAHQKCIGLIKALLGRWGKPSGHRLGPFATGWARFGGPALKRGRPAGRKRGGLLAEKGFF